MFAKLSSYLNLVVLAALILSGWLATSSPSALAAPPASVTMKVEPYFSGHFKFGEWLPLHVTLANDGPALRVEVRADTTEAGSQTTFVVPVELPTGARKRITLYVQPPSFAKAVRVRLMDGARELESQSIQVMLERNVNYVVGVIAPRSEPFAVLNGLTLNSAQAAQGIELKWTGSQQPRPVRVIPMPLSDIPDRPDGLRALDALVITGVDTNGLAPEQATALQGWVEQGGRLIVGGGASAVRTLVGLPDALVGDWRSPGAGAAEVQSLQALGKFAEQDVRVPGPFVVTWPSAGAALIEQDGHTLLAERSLGDGHVNYAALDLAVSPFDAWAGALRFWEKLLAPGSTFSTPPDVSPRTMRANSIWYTLQNLPTLDLPSIRWLAGLLAVYIVLIGPVNYLLLRRLRKLEWGWFTIAALTALFSVGAFAMGFAMRGGEVIINKLSILTFNTGAAAAPMQSYVGIFSPARRAYTLSFPGRALVTAIAMEGNPWGGASGPASNMGATELVQGELAQARGVQVNQWTMQGFQTESPAPEGWKIEADLAFDGDRVRGTLVNRTSQAIQDVVLVYGSRFARLGNLPPGQSQPLDSPLQQSSGAPFPYFLTQNMGNPSPQGPSREVQVRQQLLENYFQTYSGSPQPPSHPTFIGWMQASPLDVRVEGSRWSTQQTSLVVATLSVRYPPGPVHLPPGILPARLTEAQGEVGPCGPSPNQISVNNGRATLEFQLMEQVASLRVTRMALMVNNGNGALGVVEVYDRSGKWIKLDSPQLERNELSDPARFILDDGTVRVRLSSIPGVASCWVYDLDVEGELK